MKTRILLILIVLALLAVSCNSPLGGLSGNSPSQIPDQTNNQSQLNTPVPTPTPTPLPKAHINLGEFAMQSGDYDTALNEFWAARSQSTDPDVIATAQLGVGRVLLLKSDFRGAVDQFTELLANFSSGDAHNLALFFLAKAYEGLAQPRLAADSFSRYLAAQPGPLDGDIGAMLGDALMQANDPLGAKAAFEKALSVSTDSSKDSLLIKIAQATEASGDDAGAIAQYLAVYQSTTNDFVKAQANLLVGRIYLKIGQPEQAYARFQDSVIQFPTSYDSYSGLIALVDANQTVNDLYRGIVDYYAGQYGLADSAFDRYLFTNPQHDGIVHYYKALSLYNMGEYEKEVAEWDRLIQDHPTDAKYATAFLEKSTTQYNHLQQYEEAAQSLLTFVALVPTAPEAPNYLYRAARIYELGGYLTKASDTWERVFKEYPGAEDAYPGLFQAGFIYFRLNNFQLAQVTFQRLLVLATTPQDQAEANLWVAKSLDKQGKNGEALAYYQQASISDPTGYYSIRATEILNKQSAFPRSTSPDLSIDLEAEKKEADAWMRDTFKLDPSVDLVGLGDLATNPLFQRAEAFVKLDLRDQARAEFEALRLALHSDPLNTYRLLNQLVDLGFYQSAILSSRQVLDIAGLSQEQTLTTAPHYFNHIRFGVFYRDIIVSAANESDLDPLLLFSVIRQESLFESTIVSNAGATGLMQIMPAVGQEIATDFGWPENYVASDLNRAIINVRLGAHYLKKWVTYFNGNIPAALAAYNAGIGNTLAWEELAGGDQDLFVEIVRFEETRTYIRAIAENYEIYKSIYTHP